MRPGVRPAGAGYSAEPAAHEKAVPGAGKFGCVKKTEACMACTGVA